MTKLNRNLCPYCNTKMKTLYKPVVGYYSVACCFPFIKDMLEIIHSWYGRLEYLEEHDKKRLEQVSKQ